MDTKMKYWYAVMIDREDSDWGYGSFDLSKAIEMHKNYPDGYIAVIDAGYDENDKPTKDAFCVDEIFPQNE